METEGNKKNYTRRISLEDDFMNHATDDLLYAYMLTLATYHPVANKLYLAKSKYVSEQIPQIIARMTGKTKRTIDRHLDKLIERGLIEVSQIISNNIKMDCFLFPYDKDGLYQIVDNEMLKYIINTRNKVTVK